METLAGFVGEDNGLDVAAVFKGVHGTVGPACNGIGAILVTGTTDDGRRLDDDLCGKLLSLSAKLEDLTGEQPDRCLEDAAAAGRQCVLRDVEKKNAVLFDAEVDKLERWSDDLKLSLERELKAIEKDIREIKRESRMAAGLAERLSAERRKRDLEARKSQKLRELFEARADTDRQHDELVTRLEAELGGKQTIEDLWTVRWRLD